MAYAFPEGAKLYFSQTFASEKSITALTNADPAVATSAAHGYSDGDEILLDSGWEDATDSIYKIDTSDTNTFSVLGLVTTDTNFFAAGTGTGTASKVSSWVEIPQVLSIAASGGDPRYTTIQPLAKRNAINVPTGFNPSNLTLTLGHDPSDANFKTMQSISRSLTKVAFKLVLSGGSTVYGYGYMAVSEVPALNVGQANTVQCAITFIGRVISYE